MASARTRVRANTCFMSCEAESAGSRGATVPRGTCAGNEQEAAGRRDVSWRTDRLKAQRHLCSPTMITPESRTPSSFQLMMKMLLRRLLTCTKRRTLRRWLSTRRESKRLVSLHLFLFRKHFTHRSLSNRLKVTTLWAILARLDMSFDTF